MIRKMPVSKLAKAALFTLIISVVIILISALIPRNYDVPLQKVREGTRYWDLKTGSRIAYTFIPSKGSKQPFPVIYLHGGPGGPIFDRNIEVLSNLADDGFDVYLYDQAGCGLSSRLTEISEYTVQRHKLDLEEIVNRITAGKVILIGQSWGAILAGMYIADNPSKVEKVILTGPGPILPYRYELKNISAPDSLHLKKPLYTNRQGRKKIYNLRAYMVEAFAKAFDFKLASDKEMDDFASVLSSAMAKSTVCDTTISNQLEPGAGYYCMIKTIQSFDQIPENTRQKLSGYAKPVLIMRGQCDGIPWGYVNEYTEIFKNCTIQIIPDAGHSIATEQPVQYINAIKNFLYRQ